MRISVLIIINSESCRGSDQRKDAFGNEQQTMYFERICAEQFDMAERAALVYDEGDVHNADLISISGN